MDLLTFGSFVRSDDYASAKPKLFERCINIIDEFFIPSLRAHSLSGQCKVTLNINSLINDIPIEEEEPSAITREQSFKTSNKELSFNSNNNNG